MNRRLAWGRTIAHATRAGLFVAVCAGFACSSSDNATPGEPNAGSGGQGGSGIHETGTGGTSSRASSASGGSSSGAGGSGATTASSSTGSGGSSRGTSDSAGSGGQSAGSGGRGSATSSSKAGGNGSGGTSSGSGGESSASSSGAAGGGGRGAGDSSGSSATSGSGAADGGAGSSGSSGSTFDPCPATGDCKILPFGDSITAGAGAQPGDNGGYRVELFKKALADSKHITFVGSLTSGPTTVSNVAFPQNHEGHIGYKIDQIIPLATTSQALKDSPEIVLLFIGTNDEGYTSSEAGASDRLGQLIDKIVAALPNSLLVVSSIYVFPGCTATNCAAAVEAYNAEVPGVVKTRADAGKHVLYVDMSGLPSDGLSTDKVHPNDTVGYPWIGDNWYAVITSYLH